MKELTEHKITIEAKEAVTVTDHEGNEVTVDPGGEYTTDDPDVAAAVAENLQAAQASPTVVTTYDDGEPAATSIHTGASPADKAKAEAGEDKPKATARRTVKKE